MIPVLIVYLIPVFLLRKAGAAAICAAVAVTLATGFVASNVLLAAGWSMLHGALSNGAFYVLYAVAAVAPPALGLLAGSATRGRRGRKASPDAMERSYPNCPGCGCAFEYVADESTALYTVVECPIHGPFHFSASTPLTLGRPPHG